MKLQSVYLRIAPSSVALKLLTYLGWGSHRSKVVIIYKITNNLSPNDLQDFVPPLVQDGYSYRLRNSRDIRTMYTNTNLFYNSLYPTTIRECNYLAQEIKDASYVAFYLRKTRNRAPPKYYSPGSRHGQILHARLGMQCSSLNADLYRKNIIPSPPCSCGDFQSVHYFFYYILTDFNYATLTSPYIFQKTVECKLLLLR